MVYQADPSIFTKRTLLAKMVGDDDWGTPWDPYWNLHMLMRIVNTGDISE